MPEPSAWKCQNPRCQALNEWLAEHCSACAWPKYSGHALYDYPVGTKPPEPVREPTGPFAEVVRFRRDHYGWFLLVLALVVLFVPWPIKLLALFFALLWAIAAGIWRLANR